ncbi:DHHW family protein, partial [Dolichospermum sp. ST_sed3]|nr:DHHW family protein [Dolichospermum sp. ST_sed3]
MLLIFLPLLSKIINIDRMAKNKEKRSLATKPEFRLDAILTYPHYYSVYFNDNFGFRNLLVFSNSYTKLKYLKTSPMPNKVVLGKKDWLYYSEGDVLNDCRHTNLFTENQLKKIKKILEDRTKWLKLKGSHYYLFVPPSKNSVYPEFTPPYIKPKNQKSRLDQLIEYLDKNSFVSIIDPRNFYFREKKKHILYYKNDSHWNLYGAFFGYTELMNAISKSYPSLKPSVISDYTFKYNNDYEGDLAMILAVNQVIMCDDILFIPKKTRQAKYIKPPHYPDGEIFKAETVVSVVPDSSLPVLVMFRDSYGSYLVPFISEHFSRSVYVWTPKFITDIIDYEKPQIVVQEIIERFLGFLELENPEIVE